MRNKIFATSPVSDTIITDSSATYYTMETYTPSDSISSSTIETETSSADTAQTSNSETETAETSPTTAITIISDGINSTELLPQKLLIGYDNYNKINDVISFFTYVRYFNTYVDNIIYILVKINKKLRALDVEDKNISCLKLNQEDEIAKFNCLEKVEGDIENIQVDEVLPKMDKTNLAEKMEDNLQEQKNDIISEKGMIVLDDCTIDKNSNNSITCNIESGTDSLSDSSNTTFHIVQKDGTIKEVPTKIKNDGKIHIQLEPKDSIDANMNNTLGTINNGKNLYLIFNEGSESNIKYSPNPTKTDDDIIGNKTINSANINRKKSSGGLSTGGIIAIIIPCIIVLIAIVALAMFLGKRNPASQNANLSENTIGINSSSIIGNKV